LVRRLQLLLRGVELLIGALQLFVAREHLLVGGLQLLVRRLELLDDRLEILAARGELLLQLPHGGVVLPRRPAPPAAPGVGPGAPACSPRTARGSAACLPALSAGSRRRSSASRRWPSRGRRSCAAAPGAGVPRPSPSAWGRPGPLAACA